MTPDLDQLGTSLRTLMNPSGGTLAERVCADQAARWRGGQPLPVEVYLVHLPALGEDTEGVLDVIYHEAVLRQERGEQPTGEEYATRFPKYADRLKVLLALDQALVAGATMPWSRTACETPRPQDDGLPGMIGPYRVSSRLGKGGQGEVFRAVHPGLGKDVVVKLAHAPCQPGQLEPLLAEGRVLAGIDHRNVLRVLDVGEHEGRAFLVLEYLAGLSLEQKYKQERVQPREAARLVAEIARGLEAIHARGVLHLDLKPANVLCSPDGIPRLIDFGLARQGDIWGSDPIAGGVTGTVVYMAPEQARPEPDRIGPRSDLYALGGILYFLLTGQAPITAMSMAVALGKACSAGWDREALTRSAAPIGLKRLCERALSPSPEDRPASAGEMASALESMANPPRRWVLAAVLMPLLGLAAWWLWPHTPRLAEPVGQVPVMMDVSVKVKTKSFKLLNRVVARTGDRFQIAVELPAGHHAVLLARDADGKVARLASWPAGEARWERHPADAAASLPLKGTEGTEGLFVLVRKDPFEGSEEGWLAGEAWPQLPTDTLLRANQGRVWIGTRAFGPEEKSDDPVSAVFAKLEKLRLALVGKVAGFDAVVFPHRDDD